MDTKYRSKGHCKFLLRYHLILVCKYRLKLMSASNISSDIKKLSEQIAKKHNVDIWYLESDKDHIHYMIEVEPNTNLANFVKTLKSYTTYHIWKKYPNYLRKCFWKERTFWSDGYFIAIRQGYSRLFRRERNCRSSFLACNFNEYMV